MSSDYKRKERETINRAYDLLGYLASACDWTAPGMLKEALKIERRERSCITAAKALIVECAAEGMDPDGGPCARDLYGYARGCMLAVVLGAGLRDRILSARRDDQKTKRVRFMDYAAEAHVAHRAAQGRALDALV
ncbi:MAG: hypothetical protein GY953_31495 [bacterium]|nr:hypothetical protein [bacterium]